MPGAPKGNKNAIGNKGGGRTSEYKPAYADQAFKIAILGATDKDLADIFDVCETTINNWKREYIEFNEALKNGKVIADARVAESLFKRAIGYEHEAIKIMQYEGQPITVKYTEHYPPDTTAAIFWLKNRQPKAWRDKQEIDHRITKVGLDAKETYEE